MIHTTPEENSDEETDRTPEENFATLPDEEMERAAKENFSTLPDEEMERTTEENFASLPDEEIAKVRKRARSARRTIHIESTCTLQKQDDPHRKRIIIERRDAIDKEKTRMERKCEAAPGPFAVPIRVTHGDIGRHVIFSSENNQDVYGDLESYSSRTVHPRDGTPSWKARILAVRGNSEDGHQLWGVHHLRIRSIN